MRGTNRGVGFAEVADIAYHGARLPSDRSLTPGLESPTVSPLAKAGWSAVRALVPRRNAQSLMDSLWDVGARAILVTDIAACRL